MIHERPKKDSILLALRDVAVALFNLRNTETISSYNNVAQLIDYWPTQ